jgi:serine/threonine-protein kinase
MSTHPPPGSEQSRAFLQRRVAAFGFMGMVVGSISLLARPIVVTAVGRTDLLIHNMLWFNALTFGPLMLAWLIFRRGAYSQRTIHMVEDVAVLSSCAGFVGMGMYIPIDVLPEMVMGFGMGIVLILRAIFVPSETKHTVALSVLAGIPILGMTYWIYLHDAPPNIAIDLGVGHRAAATKTMVTLVWWIIISVTCASASRVIFGLRRALSARRRLGQYTLERKLGEGGMGAVYLASHAMLRRPAAIKLLPPSKVGDEDLARFEREVQMTSRLTHPNTVTVFDYGRTPDGIFYYVMELIEGVNLQRVVDIDGAQPAGRVVHLLSQAAAALAEAHEVGLIHRDVKPGNIMLCRRGGLPDVVKVVDFGLVKELDADVSASLSHGLMIQGTPQYMAPEMITNSADVGPLIDVYALGAIGYFLLCGEHVFEGNVIEVCSHHLHDAPVPPSQRAGVDIPPELERLVLTCLAKKPADRPPSARALVDSLGALAEIPRWTNADANAWWDRHREALGERPAADIGGAIGSEEPHTIDVAMRAHASASGRK